MIGVSSNQASETAFMMIVRRICTFLFWVLWMIPNIAAQDSARSSNTKTIVERLQEVGRAEGIRSITKFKENQIEAIQDRHLGELRRTNQNLNLILDVPYDTLKHQRNNERVQAAYSLAIAGISADRLQEQTLRNITVSEAILAELLEEIQNQQKYLLAYMQKLQSYKNVIDSIYSDTTLYYFSNDSAKSMRYFQRLSIVSKEITPVETRNEAFLIRLDHLYHQTNLLEFTIRNKREEMDHFNAIRFEKIVDKDTYEKGHSQHAKLAPILAYSKQKEALVLSYYIRMNQYLILCLLALVVLIAWLIMRLRKSLQTDHPNEEVQNYFTLPSPWLSATLLVASIGQFAFINPPFVFSFITWTIGGLALTILLFKRVLHFWWGFWCNMLLLMILSGLDNLILQYSVADQWMMLLLSIAGIIAGLVAFRYIHRYPLKESRIRYFILFMIITETAATLFNITGRWNLAKILLICGYSGIVIGMLFLWTIRLINEILSVIGKTYAQPEQKWGYFDLSKIGNKAPRFVYLVMTVGWLILLARNFYTYKQLVLPFQQFLSVERTIGSYTFSINGIFVFIVVLGAAILLSKLISFIAEGNHDQVHQGKKGKPGLGSWLLLVRILVICVGLFLALAGAGFPLDKITLVLGALSVGIGLGLQTLVSNLVSGLILAFEKPVNVGDYVEIDGKPGLMRSIGFRSSVVQMADGASLIIPNGDLLNQHLINWSQTRSSRKTKLMMTIGYEQPLENMSGMLKEIISQDPRVLQHPGIQINAMSFQPHGIDIEISYWTRHMSEVDDLRSDLIGRIQTSLQEKGIHIPTPVQIIQLEKNPNDRPDKKTNLDITH